MCLSTNAIPITSWLVWFVRIVSFIQSIDRLRVPLSLSKRNDWNSVCHRRNVRKYSPWSSLYHIVATGRNKNYSVWWDIHVCHLEPWCPFETFSLVSSLPAVTCNVLFFSILKRLLVTMSVLPLMRVRPSFMAVFMAFIGSCVVGHPSF